MIQAIGFIIGLYTMARFAQFLARSGDGADSRGLKVVFGLFLLLTAILMVALWIMGEGQAQ